MSEVRKQKIDGIQPLSVESFEGVYALISSNDVHIYGPHQYNDEKNAVATRSLLPPASFTGFLQLPIVHGTSMPVKHTKTQPLVGGADQNPYFFQPAAHNYQMPYLDHQVLMQHNLAIHNMHVQPQPFYHNSPMGPCQMPPLHHQALMQLPPLPPLPPPNNFQVMHDYHGPNAQASAYQNMYHENFNS